MENNQYISLLQKILGEIRSPDGTAAVDMFVGLRDVDAKVREVRAVFKSLPGLPPSLIDDMDKDADFDANSRRVRLEALAHYCKSAIRFYDSGLVIQKDKIEPCPDVSKLSTSMPNLENVIQSRWIEAQKCQHNGCYLSSIIMMGSILEALLMARTSMNLTSAYTTKCAPKKDGKPKQFQEWNLNNLIDVAVELSWIKTDRGKFSHALRESRNVVHPYVEVTTKANFDESTCRTSWEVLKASVNDLLCSL
jgi:hypothetical protein